MNPMDDFRRDVSYRLLRREADLQLTATMADIYHDIFLEVIVAPETLAITAARAEFRRCPTDFCPGVGRQMERLVGMVVGKGMNRRLLEIFGGGDGCGNLRTILLGLLPLAMNVQAAAGIHDEQEMLDTIRRTLTGTCAGYPVSE